MNMNCKTASRLISLRIDKTLTTEESEALDRHLGSCTACRKEQRDQERIAAVISGIPEPAAPEHVHERIRQAVFEQTTAPMRKATVSPLRIMALAAMLMLSVAMAYLAAELTAARAECARLAYTLQTFRDRPAAVNDRHYTLQVVPSEAIVLEQLRAFCSVRDYLGGGMRWMVTDGDQVEVGMSGGVASQSPAENRETIILNFEYREVARGEPPRVVSNPEFVLFSGDDVSVRLKGRSAGEPILRYQVFAEQVIGGNIRAEVNFTNDANSQEATYGSIVVRTMLTPGKPVLIGAGGNGDRRWELYLWGVARPAGYRGPQKEPKPL